MSPKAALVVEFPAGLNWRSLQFERPLSTDRMCRLCGVVSQETAVLPCFHPLCMDCFKGSVALGCACPLDGGTFDKDDVDKLRLRPGQILQLRVTCWNSAHGCDFVGPVSELLEHFEKNCVHHRVSCPGCQQDVPRLGIVQHYVQDCNLVKSTQAPPPNVTCLDGTFVEDLEKNSADIKRSIAELKDCYYGLQTSVNTVADDVKLCHSETRQAITEAASRLRTELPMTKSDVPQEYGRSLARFEEAYAEIKQSLEELKKGNRELQGGFNSVAGDVRFECTEAKQTITEAASGISAQSKKTLADLISQCAKFVQTIENTSSEIKLTVASLKDDAYPFPHDVQLSRPEAKQAVKTDHSPFRCDPPGGPSTNEYANKIHFVGRRSGTSPVPSPTPGQSHVSFSLPRCCCKVRWEDTFHLDRESGRNVFSDYFVLDGAAAFFSLSSVHLRGDSFALTFNLHIRRDGAAPPRYPDRRRLNVAMVRPVKHNACITVVPESCQGYQVIEVGKLNISERRQLVRHEAEIKVFLEPAI